MPGRPPAPPMDLKPLTTVRFFAALWVVLYHYWPDLKGAGAPPALIANGQLGVELFFVLSGFILAHVYLDGFGSSRFSYRGFLWARLARIYPLHLAALAAVGLMGLAALLLGQKTDHTVLYWPGLPANLLLVNAWGVSADAGWNHPAWSISAEWFAYLAFPGFAYVAWRLRHRPLLALALAGALLAAIYPLFQRLAGFPLTEATIAWGALRIVPCFAYGCAMNLLWRAGAAKSRLAARAMTVAALIACLALAAASGPPAAVVAAFGALILGLASLSSSGSRWLAHPTGVYLGEVSFAMYMTAIPWKILVTAGADKVLHLGADGLPWPLWALYLAGLIPVAALAHHLVERPARTLMRRWAEGRFQGAKAPSDPMLTQA